MQINMPALYVVATPIGNLEDITLRALRILREVKLIAAEDTRRTRQLLNRYDIKTKTTSYHEHNKWSKLDYIFDCLGENDVALVSDAGMPGIADPGYELIKTAVQRGIPVVPVPGPSVVITALAVSGLPADTFCYLGFLPPRSNQRRRLLESVAGGSATILTLEAPHRLAASLNDILAVLGDRKIAVCRELTKIHEEIFRGTVGEALRHFTGPRGELALVIAGKQEQQRREIDSEIESQLRFLRRTGEPARSAVAQVSRRTGLPRKEIYQAWLKVTGECENSKFR
jgi:16S rRNA (cytidine1402-2'-O)-methyltransferase